ncbi:MAG: hypothetical protein IH623_31670 [Verrucomicrobia bacterium]|nr:hypothetical protein [Verrucomicrobiota bacterium]
MPWLDSLTHFGYDKVLLGTPGFSPVETSDDDTSRFNDFHRAVKAAEAADVTHGPGSPG